jgi:hypothetical protein
MTPELLSVINKYSDCDIDIRLENSNIVLTPKNGYNVISYIQDNISNLSNITTVLQMFNELYIKLKEVNEFINNEILK